MTVTVENDSHQSLSINRDKQYSEFTTSQPLMWILFREPLCPSKLLDAVWMKSGWPSLLIAWIPLGLKSSVNLAY